MKDFELKGKYSNIQFEITLHNKFNVLPDISGAGKTFMFEIISRNAALEGFTIAMIDYHHVSRSISDLIAFCQNTDIVLLDNADLYDADAICKSLVQTDTFVLICIKRHYSIHVPIRFAELEFNENMLSCRG